MYKWKFCNDKLLDLVISGKKTATCCLYYDGNLDIINDLQIITNDKNENVVIIRIKNSFVEKFSNISPNFTSKEGEGNYDEWLRSHIKYFQEIDNNFNLNSLVECTEFEVVKIL